jgi:hypothetical protein
VNFTASELLELYRQDLTSISRFADLCSKVFVVNSDADLKSIRFWKDLWDSSGKSCSIEVNGSAGFRVS